jgi:hypothetical protein
MKHLETGAKIIKGVAGFAKIMYSSIGHKFIS